MKAAVLSEIGSPLVVEEFINPRPRYGEVLIQVAACGAAPTCPAGLLVVGTGERAVIEGSNAGLRIADEEGYSHPDLNNWPVQRSGLEGSLAASIGHFLASVIEGTPPVMSPEEALRAQAVVMAAKQSIATGMPADVEEPGPSAS